ncbi:MAG: hypothetical protein DKM50_10490 [Candidatus Margulisiibacteriota bacterium]|nr:MAG: hypothetical protein A2X43_07115 [Candidatus Margulisbacteria bacterium GWD2_39_127]OGI02950.1 MAG: hypothetical protein A2X42_12720 [Candidatus Margulisbacteria bacterium GWF2_38_17]OGI09457.1 MAG: hypothetical protein A2X41_12525 [Candidatus Margulisbacteria bacterium GWE2_39_32]PZM78743.1 MAG: hypothetical protein DKM50_10490 [Candidatus Margulisiibacteriota bacterium]HAR63355.1 hypothetical protein [Candidatus Margulisiibacteriota bacterium]
MKVISAKSTCLVVSAIFLLCSTSALHALSVHPSMIEVEVLPGETTTTSFYIKNNCDDDVIVNNGITAWRFDQNQSVVFTEEEVSWVQIDSFVDLEVSPNKTVKKTIVISAPSDFVGEKKIYLSFTERAPGSPYVSEIRVPVYMMSEENKKTDVRVTSFNIAATQAAGLASTNVSLSTTIILKNYGNVHMRPEIYLRLKSVADGKYLLDDQGKDTFLIAKDWPVFPEADRIIQMTLPNIEDFNHGKYLAEINAQYEYLSSKIKSETKVFEVNL